MSSSIFRTAMALVLLAVVGGSAAALAQAQAQAQRGQAGYPTRPIRFVVPFPPGGGTDAVARMLGEQLTEQFAQPTVIDNRPGAAGTLGAQLVARAAPDGHTLLLATGTFTIAAGAYRSLPYDAVKDFAAIGLIASQPLVLVVHPGLPLSSVSELLAYARAKPGALNYASGGAGGINHLAAELLARATSIQMTHVPYRGAGPALTALLAGESQLMIATLGSCLGQIQAGRLKALALARGHRTQTLPELATLQELGVRGYDVDNWYGIVAPRNVAPEIVRTLNGAIASALRAPDLRRRFAAQAFEPATALPHELAAHIGAEVERWKRVGRAAGIELQ